MYDILVGPLQHLKSQIVHGRYDACLHVHRIVVEPSSLVFAIFRHFVSLGCPNTNEPDVAKLRPRLMGKV